MKRLPSIKLLDSDAALVVHEDGSIESWLPKQEPDDVVRTNSLQLLACMVLLSEQGRKQMEQIVRMIQAH